ncbi:MAG: hypothetical protein ACXVA9_10855, partial [Bdellovibrionales bacterium]
MEDKDFYLDERNLAAYFEKDWADFFDYCKFTFAAFDKNLLYCDYHERFVELIQTRLTKAAMQPRELLEIGSALGRTFFEVCRKIPSIENAVLVEPSRNLNSGFTRIFSGETPARISILNGNVETQEVPLNT